METIERHKSCLGHSFISGTKGLRMVGVVIRRKRRALDLERQKKKRGQAYKLGDGRHT